MYLMVNWMHVDNPSPTFITQAMVEHLDYENEQPNELGKSYISPSFYDEVQAVNKRNENLPVNISTPGQTLAPPLALYLGLTTMHVPV
jgi:hypothetical protein